MSSFTLLCNAYSSSHVVWRILATKLSAIENIACIKQLTINIGELSPEKYSLFLKVCLVIYYFNKTEEFRIMIWWQFGKVVLEQALSGWNQVYFNNAFQLSYPVTLWLYQQLGIRKYRTCTADPALERFQDTWWPKHSRFQ